MVGCEFIVVSIIILLFVNPGTLIVIPLESTLSIVLSRRCLLIVIPLVSAFFEFYDAEEKRHCSGDSQEIGRRATYNRTRVTTFNRTRVTYNRRSSVSMGGVSGMVRDVGSSVGGEHIPSSRRSFAAGGSSAGT